MSEVTLISDIPATIGWGPILHMRDLVADTLAATIHDVSATRSTRIRGIINRYVPAARGSNDRVALCIGVNGYGARKFIPALSRLGSFSRKVLWIVDSFWTDIVEQERKAIGRHFDDIIYMQPFDASFYQGFFGKRALCLPWGTDALNLGSLAPDRNTDLLRVGRQPQEWEVDAENARALAEHGLQYRGRPPLDGSATQAIGTLMEEHYCRAKFILAHSNVAAPAPYTHATKAYMTARWTDTLACGASVAGMPPEGDIDLIDWPGALLRFPSLDRAESIDILAAAVAAWTPQIARRNHLNALKTLDWRWRIKTLARRLEVNSPMLDREIKRLEARILAVDSATMNHFPSEADCPGG